MLRVVIIGVGNMASQYANVIAATAGVKLVGAFGRTKSNVDRFCDEFNVSIRASSIHDLFARSGANAVIVAVNIESAMAVLAETLKFKWFILTEKPVGLSVDDLNRIIEIQKKHCTPLFVALNRRHYSSTRSAFQFLRNDKSLRVVSVIDQENIMAPLSRGVSNLVVSSWMYANSVHLIDYFNMFCRGNISKCNVQVDLNTSTPFFVLASLCFDSGDIGVYKAFWNAPGPWSVTITTHSQALEMRPLETLSRQVFPERKATLVKIDELDKKFKPGFAEQIKNLMLASQNKPHKLTSLEDYRKTHELINQIYPNKLSV